MTKSPEKNPRRPGDQDDDFGDAGQLALQTGVFGDFLAAQGTKTIILARKGRAFVLSRFDAQGTIDPTFGVNGYVEDTFDPNGDSTPSALVVEDNGIAVCGRVRLDNVWKPAIVRYSADGRLVPPAAAPGRIVFPFYRQSTETTPAESFLYAVTADNQPDPSFNFTGSLQLRYRGAPVAIRSLITTPLGYCFTAAQDDVALVGRVTEDGRLDSTFGTEGYAAHAVTGSLCVFDTLLWCENQLIAYGTESVSGVSGDVITWRLSARGQPVEDGLKKLDLPLQYPRPWACALTPEGQAVLAGAAQVGGYERYGVLMRFSANDGQTLDRNFGNGGLVVTAPYREFLAVLPRANGDLQVAGHEMDDDFNSVAIVRSYEGGAFTPSPGTTPELDPSFGQGHDGIVVCDEALLGDGINARALYDLNLGDDGSLLMAGSDEQDQGLIIGLTAGGDLDTRLLGAGVIQVAFPDHLVEEGVGIQRMPDGRLLFTAWLAGEDEALWEPGFAMFKADGSVDTDFGTGGITVVPLASAKRSRHGDGGSRARAGSPIISPDGHIIIPFVTMIDEEQTFIIRLTPTGEVDTEYHGRGYQEITYAGAPCELEAVTTLHDQRILLAGQPNSGGAALLLVLTAHGEVDSDYGTHGFQEIHGAVGVKLLTVFETVDQQLMAGGFLGAQGWVAKVMLNGDLAPSFNGGVARLLPPPAGEGRIRVAALASRLDGRVCGVGQQVLDQSRSVLIGFEPDGMPVEGFGPDGLIVEPDGFGFWCLQLQPDGKWLVTGAQRQSPRIDAVRRYSLA